MTQVECSCGRPTAGDALCDQCAKTLAYAIANIAAYVADLDDTRDLHYIHGGSPTVYYLTRRLGGTATMPIAQLRYDTTNTLHGWARVVMEEQPEVTGAACHVACLHTSCAAVRRSRWPDDTETSMAAYLARQHRWIVRQHWSPDMLDELLNLETRLRQAVDIRAPRWYAGKCLCTAELYATTERGVITCHGCGLEHDIETRRDLLLNQAQDVCVTATVAAAALIAWTDYDGTQAKLVDHIRKWRTSNALEVQDVTSLSGRDRHTYRLGDIQALLLQHARYKPRHKTKA